MDIVLRLKNIMSKALIITTLLLSGVLTWTSVFAQDRAEEYELKALLLNRLMTFVTWPENIEMSNRYFCVAGSNPFGSALEIAFAQSDIAIRYLENPEQSIEPCIAMFIAESEIRNYREWLSLIDSQPILTVSDLPRFAENGGMINLTFENRRVRFRINNSEANLAKLNLSYQLLNLSVIVETGSGDI